MLLSALKNTRRSAKFTERVFYRAVSQAALVGVLTSSVVAFAPAIASAVPSIDHRNSRSASTSDTHNKSSAKPSPTFDQLMSVGYAASAQGDFHTALINFRRALELQPNQPYAVAAADNMVYYMEHARMTARQWEIDQLEARLVRARSQKDWVCAATTIDQLTMYTEPNSLNRERLVGHRGEISGLLDARRDIDAWSSVCGAQRPVY
ncbi:MAG: hypothetical protein AAFN12_06305 [Cyanobacteria bacterium J06560_2]